MLLGSHPERRESGTGLAILGWDLGPSHLSDVVQDVHVTFERLTEHQHVPTQLRGPSLTQDGPPLVVDLQQVDLSVPLVLLQFVLGTEDKRTFFRWSGIFLIRGQKTEELDKPSGRARASPPAAWSPPPQSELSSAAAGVAPPPSESLLHLSLLSSAWCLLLFLLRNLQKDLGLKTSEELLV